jgi:hypothetical protein
VNWLSGATQGADQVATKAADPSITPAQAKQLMVDYLTTGVSATKSFGQAVKSAGAPKINNGAKIQALVLAGIAGSGAKLAVLLKAAKVLPTKRAPVFEKGATKIGNQLSGFSSPFSAALSKVDKLDKGNALGNVLQTLPECAPLSQGTTTTTGG